MSTINSFLQKLRMQEQSHGMFMVVLAYVVSAVLLVLGSDLFYGVTTKAEKLSILTEEEAVYDNQLNQLSIIDPYGVDQPTMSYVFVAQDLEETEDTYWIMGKAMDTEEYTKFLLSLEKLDIATEQQEEESTVSDTRVVTEDERVILERIVEAEAGSEDMKGRILIANVIFNRMEHKNFPDTVKEVVFQKVNGDYQFSPIKDKRYWSVTVSSKTKEAVTRALEGEDYSEGALYFMARKISAKHNVKWFDSSLTRLFKHGGHEFFTNK